MCHSRSHRHRHTPYRAAHDPGMRASDADRERTADVLRRQAGEGRLEPDELEERLEAAYSARTLGDLDDLVRDLPREHRPRARTHAPRAAWSYLTLAIAALVAFSIVAGHALVWLLFPLFFIWRGHFAPRPRWRRI